MSSGRLFGFLIILPEAAAFAHCPSAPQFPYCPPATRFACFPAVARFRYCPPERPLPSLLFLRRPFRLRFIFSPIGAFIVPPSLCLLSCRRSTSLLFPRCPFLFIIIPPQASPFAHCPSVSPRKPFASAPPKTARCAYFPPEGRLFSYSPSQGCSVYLLSPNPLGFPNVSPKGARFV